MKSLFVFVLLAASAFAQDATAIAAAEAACGPKETQFDFQPDKGQHPVSKPEAGRALVYVVEDQRSTLIPCLGNCGHITKLGMDGTWMGANRGSSYFFFSVEPGEHHLCASWLYGGKRAQDRESLASLTAESGHTYYFRVKATVMVPPASFYSIDLEPVNDDEGQLLVAASPFSVFHQKK
jgi:hypothetical protein